MAEGFSSNVSLNVVSNVMEDGVVLDVLSKVLSSAGSEMIIFLLTVSILQCLRLHRQYSKKTSVTKKQVDADHGSFVTLVSAAPRRKLSCPVVNSTRKTQANIPSKNKDPVCSTTYNVAQTITQNISIATALAFYAELRKGNQHLRIVAVLEAGHSKHTALDYYGALVQCAGRGGEAGVVMQLFEDMADAGLDKSLNIYESAMRLLASKKYFKEAVAVFELLEKDGLEPSPTTLSCQVGFAVELGRLDRALSLFDKHLAQGKPSIRACMAILKVYARRNDWIGSLELYRNLVRKDVQIDCILLNMVLTTGVSCGRIGPAEELLAEEPGASIADVISYNILLKGFAQQGEMHKSLELMNLICNRGVIPNLITFNTSMDAAVRASKNEDAWKIFNLMASAGISPDKCTCTTLVKGLVQHPTSEKILLILDVFDKVLPDCSQSLANRLLSDVLDAGIRISDVQLAMRTFAMFQLLQIRLTASELINLLRATANAQDNESCYALWVYASQCEELMDAWNTVAYLMQSGNSIVSATLMAPQFAVRSQRRSVKVPKVPNVRIGEKFF